MGYTTDFEGHFKVTPELKQEHADYINMFSGTRRMKRDASVLAGFEDPIREAVGLPIGDEGSYFVGGDGFRGQDRDASIIDYNSPPSDQPGLWCQWVIGEGGGVIEWDEGEKFYDYVEWLEYLISHFLKPWGYTVNGEVQWWGEDDEDRGTIIVVDNEVSTRLAQIIW